MRDILLEICCGSLDDAVEAERGGADRVELCSALFLGGLTPSLGTIVEADRRLDIPFLAMVRPRGGGFRYSAPEFASMERDVELAVEAGADGVVFGILHENGTVDGDRTRRLVALAGERETVFHRAFDVTPDPFVALDQLVDLGITRVLTSGQKDSVPEGAPLIRRLLEHAAGRIEVLPGGGIAAWNVRECVERTGCRQVHLTAFRSAVDPSTHACPQVTFGGALQPAEDRYDITDAALVSRLRATLRG
jgi:copper homeostasis protein